MNYYVVLLQLKNYEDEIKSYGQERNSLLKHQQELQQAIQREKTERELVGLSI